MVFTGYTYIEANPCNVARLMGTSGGIRAFGTASLVTRVGAGGVEDFAHVARVLHAAPDECGQLQLAVDLAVRLIGGCDHAGYRWWRAQNFDACRFGWRGTPRRCPAV